MKLQHISVFTLALYGAVSAYAQITLNSVPERAIGTPQLVVENSPQSPNLVAGREFYAPQAVALDTSVSPPIIYVSDYVNNRVLAWKNANGFTTGQTADLAIGQPDLFTTFPSGPAAVAHSTSSYTTGLSRPSGLAVDKSGNLYVADGGNNRIVRYPKPFAQTSQFPEPDLWIGQATLNGYGANYPNGTSIPTAQGLFLSNGSTVLGSSLAFDGSGNLWVLDSGNVRALRFNATSLAAGGGSLSADTELGQPNLTSLYSPLSSTSTSSYLIVNQFIEPNYIAIDSTGNLYVADLSRVLVFPGPNITSGMSASNNILGVFPSGYTPPASQTALQMLLDQSTVAIPSGIFFLSGGAQGVGVVDSYYNRIMIFPPFSSWTATAPTMATTILGQPNATCAATTVGSCKAANNGNPQPSNSTFSAPSGAAYTGTDLYLADSGNNRVLDLPQQGASFGPAGRILGQDYSNTNSPNLLEGREFQFTGTLGNNNTYSDAGMAIDNSSGTPHLYVADPYNNRVLGFKDLRTFQNGGANKADIVLGQKDFTTGLINYPSGNPNTPSNSSLYRPVGLLIDANGNLYVADSLNGRVLRFPAPFGYTGSAPEQADLVLGQQNFTTTITDPSNTNMAVPYGLAFSPTCDTATQACAAPNGLVVSDQADNRVLYIPMTNGVFNAGTDNGKAATIVFGQPSFSSPSPGSAPNQLNGPHHVACDTTGIVYVADSGNNRILIFPNPSSIGTAPFGQQSPFAITGLSNPEGIYVSPHTGEIWVANTNAGTSLRYNQFQSTQLTQTTTTPSIPEISGNFKYSPLAAVQDQYGDLFVADTAHRVAIYYPGASLCNGASFVCLSQTAPLPPQDYLAPGVIATLFPCINCSGQQFVGAQAQPTQYPLPNQLSDVEVTVNGIAAALYYVSPGQINFIVPSATQPYGNADLEVIQVSTGQVLGAAQVPMNFVAPAALGCPGGQAGPTVFICTINDDGTVNSATNPAIRGAYVSLYMTGEGAVPGAPPDGTPATTTASAQYPVTVLINAVDVNDPAYQESSIQHILYSGIDALPGVWQINVQIPKTVVPSAGAAWIAVIIDDVATWSPLYTFKNYIFVK